MSSIPPHVKDAQYRDINFELCRALDLTKLGIILDRLVVLGALDKEEARVHRMQAGCLLTLLRRVNDRRHGKQLSNYI